MFYFMPSVSAALLFQPLNVSGNEVLSRVPAIAIAYKMYNFTVNQI